MSGIVVIVFSEEDGIENVMVLGSISGELHVGVVTPYLAGYGGNVFFGGRLLSSSAVSQDGVYYLQSQSFVVPESQSVDQEDLNAAFFFDVLNYDPLVWRYDSARRVIELINNPHRE
ncbi:MAG: hypothetical protein MZU97_06120 [Bacillus subtilis]|nr:hypothetical protein [Bacillus subtilis]